LRLSSQADPVFQEAFSGFAERLPFFDVRSIEPGTPPAHATVATLMETAILQPGATLQWPVEVLPADSEVYFKKLMEPGSREELNKLLRTPPTPVAVTVRDKGKGPDPSDPHAFMRQDSQGAPRMVVFGNASMASNTFVEGGREIYYNLIVSALGWLRDRPELVTAIQPKERKAYRLNVKPGETSGILFTPGIVLLLAIIACGVGVWFIRRR
jgi:hypothetical protein